jgi:adenosylcobinamide-phosphate synthase
MTGGELLMACAIDGLIGDPPWLPHPVRLMGRAIEWYEGRARAMVHGPGGERVAGVLLATVLPALAYAGAWSAIELGHGMHDLAGVVVVVGLGATTLAARDLVDHARDVLKPLQAGTVENARLAVSKIVGRDTAHLSESEIVRATVESIAESACDGVVAPLFYLAVGGPPLALAYKAISTLDSMVGHQDARYRYFGWASARLDDAANWIPARVTAGLLVIAASLSSRNGGAAWRVVRRDGHKHPSPNSGRPEAAMAGALRIRLGGVSLYDGNPFERPYLGDEVVPLQPFHIASALRLMMLAATLAVAASVGALVLRS